MKAFRSLACLMVVLSLSACGKSQTGCGSEATQAALTDIVHGQLEKATKAKLEGGSQALDLGKIRAAIAQVSVTLDDVRTDKSESGGKADCTASLKLKIAASVLNDAFSARQKAKLSSVEDVADSKNIDHKGDTYWSNVTYHIAPTDDGKKVVARLDDGATLFDFGAEVVASAAALGVIDQAAQQAQAQQAQADAALVGQQAADMAAARAQNQLAVSDIKKVWGDIPLPVRQQILPLQRAWLRKKDADCLVEAANATANSTGDPATLAGQREIARLTCDTREQEARSHELEQYRGGSGSGNQPSY